MPSSIGGFSPSSAGLRSESMTMRSKPQVAIEARPQQRVVGFQGTSVTTPAKKDIFLRKGDVSSKKENKFVHTSEKAPLFDEK